ncbi:MAG: glycoside hydrolase family 3 protein [Chitinophagia bacterium]|nr:glycoside hydrolase family 3 protein [Chitinophagia bacterium]NCA29623.1 glycoside hydrolase family 3 protein [Chitinophagia bacterium]NDD16465.1 glycoside hydrolase family 3 protein [Chitinophagia bacterium]
MKKIFKFIGYALLSIIGFIAILLTSAYIKSYFKYKEAAKLIGKEAPVLSIDGHDFRDLNKNGKLDAYEDYRVNIEDRITNLIGQMSLEEKAGAMFITMAAMNSNGDLSETKSILNPISYIVEGNSAMVLGKNMNHLNTLQSTSPEAMVVWHNNIQKLAERTRLGIPITVATDPRHGVPNAPGASIYSPFFSSWPSTLGLAATRDSALVRAFGDIARQEYKALGFRLSLSPMADLATEPRWGRINGTFGEDAELAASMTKAYILGYQGDTINENSVECMVKHFSGGGPQEDGRDAHFPPGRQRYKGGNFNYHLIPFVKGAFAAGAAQVMPYYGIPMGQTNEDVGFGYNKEIITGLLRNQYKFDGIVCTDWGLVTDAKIFGYTLKPAAAHGVEKLTAKQRIEKIINAGCDMFGGEALPSLVVELVKEGKISEKRIDSSMRRILKEKFRLGLFDHPYLDPAGIKIINNAGFAAKGIEAQQKSLVLLKNDANILPLKAGTKIFLEGFNKEETKGLTNKVNDAEAADVIVLKIGTPDNAGSEKYILQRLFNHGSLAFSDKEEARLLKIIQSKPTITVINLQRPAVIPSINKYSKALIADFSSQDNVILDLIMGKFKPTGKLPFELPSSMEEVLKQKEDLPYDTQNPLYKFGAGIEYK